MISRWLSFERPLVELEEKIEELKRLTSETGIDRSEEIKELEEKATELKKEIFANLSPYDKTQLARHPRRPYTLDYINLIFDDFIELHGDRCSGEDLAIVGGLGSIEGKPVMVMGHQRGRDTKERQQRNFGSPGPSGFRKAIRLVKLASKMRMPIVSFIDTSGAACLVEAEEHGISWAIAESMRQMSQAPVPIIVVVIGEGGSGGAIGIGVGDRILMLEHSIYSVISPESCAAIIWRDSKEAPRAAEALKLTAQDLLHLGIIDEIIPEPLGGAHRDYDEIANRVKEAILRNLDPLLKIPRLKLVQKRYEKFRKMGVFVVPKVGVEPTRPSRGT